MKRYCIELTETLTRTVTLDESSERRALDRIERAYAAGDLQLDADNSDVELNIDCIGDQEICLVQATSCTRTSEGYVYMLTDGTCAVPAGTDAFGEALLAQAGTGKAVVVDDSLVTEEPWWAATLVNAYNQLLTARVQALTLPHALRLANRVGRKYFRGPCQCVAIEREVAEYVNC